MAGFGSTIVPGCSYKLNASSFDAATNTAMFFGAFTGTHTGVGGRVPPTNKQTKTQCVYILTMNNEAKIKNMVKVWNAPWALKELGWM